MTQSAPNATRFVWQLLAFGLILLGTTCSGYLLAQHLAVRAGGTNLFDICQAVFGGDCKAAIRSDLAMQLGIPLAGWGLIHFVVVAVALVLALSLGDTFRNEGTLAAMLLCVVASVLGAGLSALMLSGAAAFCPLCFAVHAINLVLIPVVPMATGRTVWQLRGAIGRGFRFLAGADETDPVVARWKVTGLVTLALVGIVGYQWILIQTDRLTVESASPITFEQVLAEFEAGKTSEIPLSDDDPRLGDAGAPLQLVLFSDFECPACQRFARTIAQIREHHPELSVVFKHYPLSSACNPVMRRDLHPLSCGAAYAAEAARRQGKFWEYHDALFASKEPLDDDVLKQVAQDVGLDVDRFEADRSDAAAKAKVDADLAAGKKLEIPGTPTVFFNSKLVSGHGMAFLSELVDHEAEKRKE